MMSIGDGNAGVVVVAVVVLVELDAAVPKDYNFILILQLVTVTGDPYSGPQYNGIPS